MVRQTRRERLKPGRHSVYATVDLPFRPHSPQFAGVDIEGGVRGG